MKKKVQVVAQPPAATSERAAFGRRLSELLDRAGMSASDLAKMLGVSYEMARRYTKGVAVPEFEGLVRLAKLLGVSPLWLATGQLDQLAGGKPEGRTVRMLSPEEAANYESAVIAKAGRAVTVEAGTLAMRIEGSEMAVQMNPGGRTMLITGDYVVIDAQAVPAPGDYVVARRSDRSGTAVLRRYMPGSMSDPSDWRLIANNPDYPPITSSDGYEIIGTVTEFHLHRRQ